MPNEPNERDKPFNPQRKEADQSSENTTGPKIDPRDRPEEAVPNRNGDQPRQAQR